MRRRIQAGLGLALILGGVAWIHPGLVLIGVGILLAASAD